MKPLKYIVGLLLAVGIIFGTFAQFAAGIALGFTWFTNLLWFAIGFPVLFLIGYLIFGYAWALIDAEVEKLEKS